MTDSPLETEPAAAPPEKSLPFSGAWPLVAGILLGIGLRLVFMGPAGHRLTPMAASFIYLVPIVVGAVTVYVAELTQRRTWTYYFAAAFTANMFFVFGTLLIMIEGMICVVIILPLFACIGGAGGLVMGAFCRITKWPRGSIYAIGALPLLLGTVEGVLPPPQRNATVVRSVLIDAPPQQVWQQIQNAVAIQPQEVERAWLFRIGVPLPQAGISSASGVGGVRTLSMGKSVHFDQIVTDWEENQRVRWQHRYAPDSFPPHALDDHVVLGGHYFDVSSSAYSLVPRGAQTELRIELQYRVSTMFNWYADPVARHLLGNLEGVILEFYRQRSERAAAQPAAAAAG